MNSYEIGQAAERAASEYLESLGFRIITRNWRTKWCEIDIIAIKAQIISFIEVKYRSNIKNGSGLEYITLKKLDQMTRAAESFVQAKKWDGQYQLAAIEVTGNGLKVTSFLDSL